MQCRQGRGSIPRVGIFVLQVLVVFLMFFLVNCGHFAERGITSKTMVYLPTHKVREWTTFVCTKGT
jgi:hypothetical protein